MGKVSSRPLQEDVEDDYGLHDDDVQQQPSYKRIILPDDQWKNPMIHRAPFICTCHMGWGVTRVVCMCFVCTGGWV